MLETSLKGMPGTKVDEFGNLNLKTKTEEKKGLRGRYEFLRDCPPRNLKNRILAELLNWFRWGACADDQPGVMWECSPGELLLFIEKWEWANPEADRKLYGGLGWNKRVSWEKDVWQHAQITDMYERRFCKCNKDARMGLCLDCDTGWLDARVVIEGPRGPGTYNLELAGRDGDVLAAAAWYSRGQNRPLPPLSYLYRTSHWFIR